jgi:hypothetical protein
MPGLQETIGFDESIDSHNPNSSANHNAVAAGHRSADKHARYANVDERLALHIAVRLDQLHQSRQCGKRSHRANMSTEKKVIVSQS